MPTISLIIRTRNEVAHIEQVLDGVLEQVVKPDEVIVVDSGSTDGTLEKIFHYDVKLINIPYERFTYGYSYNEGARTARGDFLISISAHALPTNPLWIKNLLQPLLDDPAIAGVSSRQLPFPGQSLEPYLLFWQTLYHIGLKTPIVNRYLFSNACSAIRSFFWRQTPFDETAITCEDHQWATKMQRKGYRIAYASNSCIYHSHQMSTITATRRRFRELLALIRFYAPRPEHFRF